MLHEIASWLRFRLRHLGVGFHSPLKMLSQQAVEVTPLFQAQSEWCKFGVRDPAILMDRYGNPVLSGDSISVFFNGRDRPMSEGGSTRIGKIALSLGDLKIKEEQSFLFEDGAYAAQGSVLKIDSSEFWMYYSFATDQGFRRATSRDGLSWNPGKRTILEPKMFGCTRIGLPYVFWCKDRWIMYLEGIRAKRFSIFGAASDNGEHWTPLNDGKPMFLPDSGDWDGGGQANPSVTRVGDISILLYNGHSEADQGGWDVGVADSGDPTIMAWRNAQQPIISREGSGWCAGRVEGARYLRSTSSYVDILFFALPTKDSYFGGTIGLARFGTEVS